jgi:branched-subunit amino acid aminotransferase/4-amino-4-deoxychorismate lyase
MTDLTAESPAVAAGLGLFETLLVAGSRAVQLDEHFVRMAASCEALGLPLVDEGRFREEARGVPRAFDGALRILWMAAERHSWVLHATTFALPPATLSRRKHGRAVTLPPHWTRSLPQHKLTSYAVCAIALRDAARAGADEALFVTSDGRILEGTSTNVFATHGTTLITAPVAAGILPGTVRAWVIARAAQLGLTVEERPPTREEVLGGSFFTGSLTTLAPVRTLDGLRCAPPAGGFAELVRLYAATAG